MSEHNFPGWNFQIPVDLRSAARYGFEFAEPIPMAADAAGYIAVRDGLYVLAVNSLSSKLVARFTYAYMIAYCRLNKPSRDVAVARGLFNLNLPCSYVELLCRKMTLAYLMPKMSLDYYVMHAGITDISDLARIHDVSELAVHSRLRDLRWI